MEYDIDAVPEVERGIETHGIEPVLTRSRTHVSIFDNFTMWFSANLAISTVALGMLATTAFSLGFWDSVMAIILFNVFGSLPVAFLSTLGPRLGLRQMTISRFSFGWFGAIVMVLCNVAACIGWSAVNVIVGGQLVAALSGGVIPQPIGVLAITIATTILSIYGYKYIHRYERYAWMPMAVVFYLLFLVSAPKMSIIPTPALSVAEVASFISFGGGRLWFRYRLEPLCIRL